MDEKDLQIIKGLIRMNAKKIMQEEGLCIDAHPDEYKKNCRLSCEGLLEDIDTMLKFGDWQ